MRTFSRTSQFKRDVRLAAKHGKNLEKLRAALDLLIEGRSLPPAWKDHPLRGNFTGSRDCHIEPDGVLSDFNADLHGHHSARRRWGGLLSCGLGVAVRDRDKE